MIRDFVKEKTNMIKRMMITGLLLISLTAAVTAQANPGEIFKVTGDLTTIYTFGNANEAEQSIGSSAAAGIYDEKRNGFYTSANAYLLFSPASFIDGYLKLSATSRPGSLYLPLQLESYGKSDFTVSFDSVYGRLKVLEALLPDLPVDLNLKAGKYKTEPSYFGKVSKYETESVLYMVKTANTFNYEAEVIYDNENASNPLRLSGAFTTNYLFDEAVQRLYDVDGSVSDHGLPVVSEYAGQLYGSLKLHNLNLGPGQFQAEALYALNGADIYSGNSGGADFRYTIDIVPGTIRAPIGLGFAMYEKNIDALSGTSGTETGLGLGIRNTTDFRTTIAGGVGVGLRYTADPLVLDVNLGGSLYSIEHFYRDPLNVFSLSLDTQFTYNNRFFAGAGFIAGTLADATWETSQGKNEPGVLGGAYKHVFSFANNVGYEVYAGIKFYNNSRFIIGFNQNKGLAMNRSLESKEEGQIKYRQKNTDDEYEVSGLYFKFVFSW
jgi:hypothetical protein